VAVAPRFVRERKKERDKIARGGVGREREREGKRRGIELLRMRPGFLSPRVVFLLLLQHIFVISNAANSASSSSSSLHSSQPLRAPDFLNVISRRDFDIGTHQVPINPLTCNGREVWPIGYADVFSSRYKEKNGRRSDKNRRRRRPDVFLSSVGAKFDKITLYEHVESDDGRTFAPFFFRRNHVTHPFSGLKPPKAKCVSQNAETKEIYGFFVVEGNILARSRYDEASGGFVGRKEVHVTGIRGNWKEIENVVCVPGRTDFVYLLVNDYRKVKGREYDRERARILWKYEAPRYDPMDGGAPNDEEMNSNGGSNGSSSSSSSSGDNDNNSNNNKGDIETSIWKLEVGEAEDAKDSARAKKAKMPPPSASSDDEIDRLPIVSAFGLEDGSILLGHSGGEITMYRKNPKSTGEGSENEDDFVAHERVLIAPGNAPLNAHPAPNAVPMPYPYSSDHDDDNNNNDANDGSKTMKTTSSSVMPFDLLVGGVGSLYHYKRYVASTPYSRMKKSAGSGLSTEDTNAKMVFYPPRVCGEEDADTFVASLGTISLVDLDNDGREDIVSGSAEGVLYALKNVGTNAQPSYMPPSAIETKSEILRLVPDGSDKISPHGPRESRFGYTTVATFDWNQDGKFDILVNDFSGEMSLLENIGKPSAMKFDAVKKLYREMENGEKEVFKTDWQVKPFVGTIGKKIIVVAPCPDTSILLVFEKIGDALVKKIGALKLNDEKETRISTHTLYGGARGRLSIDIVDFDGDDVLDVLITAPKHASVPDPERGLPLHVGHYQAALLFLKGKSDVKGDTESDINTVRFKFPEIVQYKGEPMYVGKLQGSVVATSAIGTSSSETFGSLPNLMVVCDAGRVYWYDRKDLSTRSIKTFVQATSSKKSGVSKNKSKPASRELERGWAVQFLSGTASPQCKAFDGGLVDYSALAYDASTYTSGGGSGISSGNGNTATASTFATVLLVLIFFACVVIAGVGWSRFWFWARGQVAARFNVSLGRTERREV
jgi:hypothetical protein